MSCPLVQAVDVLGDQGMQLATPFERHERAVPRIGFGMPCRVINAALPGELTDLRIRHVVVKAREPFGLGVPGPNALRPPEVGNTGFGRDTGAGQRDNGPDPSIQRRTLSMLSIIVQVQLPAQFRDQSSRA